MKIYFQEIIKNERETKEDEEEEINKEIIINQHEPFFHYVHLIFVLNFQLRRIRNLMKRVSGTLSHSGWLLSLLGCFLTFAHI